MSGQTFPSPGDLPDPGMEPESPTLQVDSLPSESPGNVYMSVCMCFVCVYHAICVSTCVHVNRCLCMCVCVCTNGTILDNPDPSILHTKYLSIKDEVRVTHR